MSTRGYTNKVKPGTTLMSSYPNDEESKEWFLQAACKNADPDLFFPIRRAPWGENAAMMAKAITICNTCPVIGRCLDLALTSSWEPWGVMGGRTPGHLVKLRKEIRRRQLRSHRQ